MNLRPAPKALSQASCDVFLHPGQYHFGAAPGHISTLLGSCVSVTVWHPGHRVGGMCHILLPERQRPRGTPPDARFAQEAVEILAHQLRIRGIAPQACQVELFGGGNMFTLPCAMGLDVGRRNIETARLALTQTGFIIQSEHVGGTDARRLHFDLGSGQVRLSLTQKISMENKETA